MRARILSGLLGGAIGLAPALVSAQPLTLGEAVRQALAQDDAVQTTIRPMQLRVRTLENEHKEHKGRHAQPVAGLTARG